VADCLSDGLPRLCRCCTIRWLCRLAHVVRVGPVVAPVDAVNTFRVSAGRLASFRVLSRRQIRRFCSVIFAPGSIPSSSTENMQVKHLKYRTEKPRRDPGRPLPVRGFDSHPSAQRRHGLRRDYPFSSVNWHKSV